MSNVLRGAVANPEKVYGKSAYEIAVSKGFEGTEEEWIAYLEVAQSEALKDASEKAQADIESDRQTALSDIEEAKAALLEDIEIAGKISQTPGESDTAVMSQKAVAKTVADIADSSNFDTHMKEKLIRCAYAYGDYQESPLRVSTDGTFYLPFDAYVEIASGYRVVILHYNSSTPSSENCTNKETAVWIDRPIVAIPKNVYSTFTVAKIDNSEITIAEAKNAVKFYNSVYTDKMLTMGQADSNVLDSFLKSWFIQSGINPDGDLVPIATRVCLRVALKFPNKVLIDVPNGYQITIHTFTDSEIKLSNHIIGLDWNKNSVVVIDSKDYVAFALAKVDGSNITIEEAQRAFKFRVPLDEKIENYHYTGEAINFDKHSFKVKEIISAPYTIHQGVQGFDIHNGIIAQFESDNMLRLIDLKTGETIAEYTCAGFHGSSLAFSKQYMFDGDEFPLLYVCCGNYPKVYVNRITRTGYATAAIINYSESDAGYWTSACFDFENKKMYLMGYTENSYSDNTSGKNLLKLTTWDMSKSTEDGYNISYTLESTKTFPYVYCLQSLAFHDGKIFALISVNDIENTEILVIDPANGNVVANFKDFPHAMSIGEAEGLSFADVGDSSQMIVSVKGGDKFTYYGLTFAQTSNNESAVKELKQWHEALVDEVENTNERITDTNARIDKTEKRITNLEQGLMADSFEVDDSVAYVKDVPTNALPYAAISKVGGMTRKCTNLIPYPYSDGSITFNGIEWTVNADGTITANGTATENSFYVMMHAKDFQNGKYHFRSLVTAQNGVYSYLICNEGAYFYDYGDGISFNLTSSQIQFIGLLVESGVTVSNLVFRPMLNEGETALPYEPYFEGLRSVSATEVESVGVNLIDLKDAPIAGNYVFHVPIKVTEGEYCISVFNPDGTTDGWNRGNNYSGHLCCDNVPIVENIEYSKIVTKEQATRINKALIYINPSAYTGTATTMSAMLNKGATALPYTPYVKHTLPIPTEVRPAHGINNEVYDYLDFGEQESVVRVGVVDMGTLNWEHRGSGIASAYLPDTINSPAFLTADLPNGITTVNTNNGLNSVVVYYDSAILSLDELNTVLSGVQFVYELAEPIVTDISDILPADNLIGVEGGGTITMVNEHEYAVPSEIIYQAKGVSV